MLWTDALKTFLMSNVFFYHGICSHPSYHTVTSSLAWVGWGTPPKFAWPRTCPATKLYINGKSSMKSPAPDNYIMSLADFFESDAGSELWFSKLAAWLQIHTTIQFNQLFWVVFHWGLALFWVATCSHCGCQWFWGEIKQKIAYGHQSNYSKGFHFSSVPLIFPLSQVEVAKKNQDKEWALEVLQMQDIKPFEPVAAAQCSALALVEAAQGAAAATAVVAAQCSALALLKAAQVAAQWAPADPVVAAQCFALALVEAAQVAAHWLPRLLPTGQQLGSLNKGKCRTLGSSNSSSNQGRLPRASHSSLLRQPSKSQHVRPTSLMLVALLPRRQAKQKSQRFWRWKQKSQSPRMIDDTQQLMAWYLLTMLS